MQTLNFGTDVSIVPPAFFFRPLRDVFKVREAELHVAVTIRELMDRIADDEILFDVRNIPAIGHAGICGSI